ncbi:MAG: hypothetical protein FWD02_02370 [Bacteroidales bacterium]|nr:hypothetical protein [Bacteroidales bacterium]
MRNLLLISNSTNSGGALLAVLGIFLLLFTSCREDRASYGFVVLAFEHQWNGEPMRIDGTTQYTNAAGNVLSFTNLEYMISHLTVSGGASVMPVGTTIHYMGVGDPTMQHTADGIFSVRFAVPFEFPVGTHQKNIEFMFGIPDYDNISGIFPNPPERDMFWPEHMYGGGGGGGWHFMKLDGRWLNPPPNDTGAIIPRGFGMHLGRLIRNDSVFHNHFPVSIQREFEIKANEITTVTVIMDVEQWLQDPYIWDFNVMPTGIMSSEHAMDSLAQNGRSVFR